jgi:hypothetical protein
MNKLLFLTFALLGGFFLAPGIQAEEFDVTAIDTAPANSEGSVAVREGEDPTLSDLASAGGCGGQPKPSSGCTCHGGPGGYPYDCWTCGTCHGGPGGYPYSCWTCRAK